MPTQHRIRKDSSELRHPRPSDTEPAAGFAFEGDNALVARLFADNWSRTIMRGERGTRFAPFNARRRVRQ